MKQKSLPQSGRNRPAQRTAHQTPAASPAGDLMEMEEVIALLKTTRPTFYRWLRAGKLKGTKIGRQWRFLRSDVERFLKGQEPQIDLPADITPLMDALQRQLKDGGAEEGARRKDQNELAQAVRLMIQLGAQLQASDLHLDPGAERASVRYRIDGALQPPAAEFDVRLLAPIIKQWKILGACNVHETARPQDGRILLNLAPLGGELDLRLLFLPTLLGEALTVRLLDPKSALVNLDSLQYAEADKLRMRQWLQSPWGMIVITAPAGNGKTTSLYACLNHLVATAPTRKIMTVEDPVELQLPGTTQVAVGAPTNLTYGTALKSVLKADPDVIMVGEIRDLETLTIAQQAAQSGRLVLISLHTSEAATALQRMVDVGGNPFLVAEATKLIVAQRLVRLLCPKCSVKRSPSEESMASARKLARIGGLAWDSLPGEFREPVGCLACHQTGYLGRGVIGEALEVTPRICAALSRGAASADVRAIAMSEGMTPLAADGIRRAAEGKTSLAEIIKIVSPIYRAEFGP